jgi:hypothetical protein
VSARARSDRRPAGAGAPLVRRAGPGASRSLVLSAASRRPAWSGPHARGKLRFGYVTNGPQEGVSQAAGRQRDHAVGAGGRDDALEHHGAFIPVAITGEEPGLKPLDAASRNAGEEYHSSRACTGRIARAGRGRPAHHRCGKSWAWWPCAHSVTNALLSLTNLIGWPWLSRSATSGSARQMGRSCPARSAVIGQSPHGLASTPEGQSSPAVSSGSKITSPSGQSCGSIERISM